MHIRRRAIKAAVGFAFSLFPAVPGMARGGPEGLRRLVDALAIDGVRDRLAGSPVLAAVEAFLTSAPGLICGLALAALIAGLSFVLRRRRETGSLTIRLLFPESVEGRFTVRLVAGPGRRRNHFPHRRSPRHLHRQGVRRETQFDRVPPGLWTALIEGEIRAEQGEAALATVFETIDVEVEGLVCREVEHALPPIEAPVELRIGWDCQPAGEVGLCLAGRPETLRYRSRGKISLSLTPGEHRIFIGSGDRVVEQTLAIAGYARKRIEIDLARAPGLVFKGCPPAVSAFLEGDLGQAARALERDGQADVAALLRARLHQEQGELARAAEQLEQGGQLCEAADLRRRIEDFERAARLYEAADEPRAAAEMYEAAEAWLEATRVWSALEDWPAAARCAERAGDVPEQIAALERQGEFLRASALASEHDDRATAIRLLQEIGPRDPDFGRAGELLALAYEQEGHLDLAAQQLERCLRALPPGEHAPQLELHLSELHAAAGEFARALAVVEALRDRDPTYPNVAAMIESLRKKLTTPGRAPESSDFTPPPGATAFVANERYEIEDEIGRGGMGLIYKARDRRLGRTVALKRMPESLRDHPDAVQLFLGEARAAARMNHPNIVTLYDADQKDGRFFITMELLEGLPLSTLLEERGRFGPRDTARLGIQVCHGLQFAHSHGIVHRDIKTSNLFVTRDKVLKIMDFGLAKIVEAVRDDGSSVIAGTPFYMAPEQSAGCVADGRTDLYSLGVTLFELSTGRLPFSGGGVAAAHRSAPPPDPAEGLPDYPASLRTIIHQLMAKAPEDRPSSAEEVAAMLTTVVEGR